MKTLYLGDYGQTLQGTIRTGGSAHDISGATTKQFVIRKPDGSIHRKAGSFLTDGTDGILTWTITDGFLDQTGEYRFQIRVIEAAAEYSSSFAQFQVMKPIR